MTTPEARRESLRDALLTGLVLRSRLHETLADVGAAGLLKAEKAGSLSKDERRITDSLALTFANLTALIQEQVLRLVLALEEYDVVGMTKRDQRQRAEAIGLIGRERRFDRVADTRNRIAHQYPRDPARQHRLLEDIAEQSKVAIAAFDDAFRYASAKFFDGQLAG